MDETLIDARNLKIAFGQGSAAIPVVHGVSFTLGREKLGIVGESGAGKSMIGRAIMRLTPPGARVTADRLAFRDTDLLTASEPEMMRLRGRRIGLILQDPKYSLNPVIPVGDDIHEYGRRRSYHSRDSTGVPKFMIWRRASASPKGSERAVRSAKGLISSATLVASTSALSRPLPTSSLPSEPWPSK